MSVIESVEKAGAVIADYLAKKLSLTGFETVVWCLPVSDKVGSIYVAAKTQKSEQGQQRFGYVVALTDKARQERQWHGENTESNWCFYPEYEGLWYEFSLPGCPRKIEIRIMHNQKVRPVAPELVLNLTNVDPCEDVCSLSS